MARPKKRVARGRTRLYPKGIPATKPIETDYDPRPNVRVIAKKTLTRKQIQRFQQIGQQILRQLRENIRTGLQGRWKKVQWDYQNGVSAGDNPLQGTEGQWEIEVISSRHIRIRPKRGYERRWRGHCHGMTIHSKPDGPRMPIPFRAGTSYLKSVQLPRRDPRPTITQMVRIIKQER